MWAREIGIASTERWDAEFYAHRFTDVDDALRNCRSTDLGAFVREAARGVAPDYPASGVRVVNSVNVRPFEFSDERTSFASVSHADRYHQAIVNKNDLVVTSTGIGTLGRVFCNLSDDVLFADGHICVLRLRDHTMLPYLCAFLQSPLGQIQLIRRRRGSSRQVEIYPEDILTVQVPRFDAELEFEIGKRWLSAVEHVAKTRNRYIEAEEALLDEVGWEAIRDRQFPNVYHGALSASGLSERFDAEFFHPRHLALANLLEVSPHRQFAEVVRRYSKGCQPGRYDPNGDITVVKSKDVVKSGINLRSCDRCETGDVPDGVIRLSENQLLINMTGVGTLGRAAVVPPSVENAVAAVDVSVWDVREDVVLSDYLALYLNSPIGMMQSIRFQTGSSGQLHLYPQHIEKYLVLIRKRADGTSDLRWQQEFVDILRESQSGRILATEEINSIRNVFAGLVGVNPTLVRE